MEDLKTLRWFVDVAEAGSFSATAARFRVTPSAVSMGISRLERQLNTRLFHRTTRQLRLTPEGETFLEKTREGLALLSSAADQLRDISKEPSGRIRISTTPSIRRPHFLPMLADFLAMHPKLSIENSFDSQVPDLIRAGIDVAIIRGGTSTSDTNYVTRLLCKLPVVLVASPAYLARKGIPRTPKDLLEHDWIISPSPDNSLAELQLVKTSTALTTSSLDDAETETSLNLHRTHTLADPGAAINNAQLPPRQKIRYSTLPGGEETGEVASLGVGIALATVSRVMDDLRAGNLKLVLPEYSSVGPGNILLQYPNRQYLSPKIRTFIDYLVQRFADEPDFNVDPASLKGYAA